MVVLGSISVYIEVI